MSLSKRSQLNRRESLGKALIKLWVLLKKITKNPLDRDYDDDWFVYSVIRDHKSVINSALVSGDQVLQLADHLGLRSFFCFAIKRPKKGLES